MFTCVWSSIEGAGNVAFAGVCDRVSSDKACDDAVADTIFAAATIALARHVFPAQFSPTITTRASYLLKISHATKMRGVLSD